MENNHIYNLLIVVLVLTSCTGKTSRRVPTEKEMGAYLFTYFSDPTHSLFMAISRDGYSFTAVNDGQPVLAGDTIAGQKGIRDPHIYRGPDGRFCMMYVAQERPGGIKMAISDSIHTGYQYLPEWIDVEPGACEAPNVWKRIGEDKWVLMYDIFSIRPNNFGFCETSDFKTFTDLGYFNKGKMKLTNAISPKHGAIIQITAEEADRLEKYWEDNKVSYQF